MTDYPATQLCPKCGRELSFKPRPDTQHWGSVICPDHGFIWLPKPDAARKPKRKANSDLINSLPVDMQHFCWACLRQKQLLSALRPSVSLQVHHIIEVANGGTDETQNLMLLCAECHAEIHRRREAFNRYENQIADAA